MLEVHELSRRFGDLVAVDRVSFTIEAGQMAGFVGGNGAGKTTAMRMIMGLLAPHHGEVLWNGTPMTPAIRSRFGYMPEERGLYPKQAIREQLQYLGELHGMTASDARSGAQTLLDRFGLGDRSKDKLETLSLGNQQRVQIAAAVLADPIGLVLDEPFSGLDPSAVDEMHDVLREYTAKGVPVLFSSHQLDLVERLVDKVIVLVKGKVAGSGTVDELRARGSVHHRLVASTDVGWLRGSPGVSAVDIDGTSGTFALADDASGQAVLREALNRGEVYEFTRIVPTLSEIYREVTK